MRYYPGKSGLRAGWSCWKPILQQHPGVQPQPAGEGKKANKIKMGGAGAK